MSVPIINSLGEMASFNQYASSQSYVYGSVAEALESGRYLSPVEIPNQINATNGARFQVVEYQPELTGGTKAGSGLVDFIKGEGRCEPFVYGSAIALSGIEVLAGVIAGLGLSIAAYEFNKDFWVDVSNNAFQNFPGYTPVTYDNIEEMSIIGMFANNKTYIPYEVVQAVNDYLISIGAYEETIEVEVDRPVEQGNYDIYSVEMTKDNIKGVITKFISDLPTDSIFTPVVKTGMLQCVQPLINILPSNLTSYTGFAVDVAWGGTPTSPEESFVGSIIVSMFTRTMPINVNISSGDIHNTYTNIGYVFSPYYYRADRSGAVLQPSITTGYSTQNYNYETPIGTWRYGNYTWRTSGFGKSVIEIPRVPELTPLPGATVSTSPGSIPLELPDWWANIVEINNPEPDSKTRLMPVGVPEVDPRIYPYPVTTPQTTPQSGVVPATNPKPVEDSPKGMFEPKGGIPEPSGNPTPTPTPTPAIPIIPAIGGQANALFTVYNPSQANLNSLGSVLWTQNIIEQIVQMFTNNPMDAIISLHILYATPSTGSNKEIKLGYLPTGISCPEVTNQYTSVNCGTVRVPEMFGDARDYVNTDISIYLPMIGFRQLKTEDVMGSNVSVVYRVDVFTGTVLATVTITKNGVNQVFYTYEGNCAVNLPLTGADKSRQVATAVGAIGAMVTGSPLMALGSATAIAGGSARAQIQRSGNFTGNAGAMGCKKPYIIVSSDVAYDAAGYQAQYGYPANITVMLGDCSGYVKVKEVHADTVSNATEAEKREIENQLKQGVIIH